MTEPDPPEPDSPEPEFDDAPDTQVDADVETIIIEMPEDEEPPLEPFDDDRLRLVPLEPEDER